MSHTNVQFSTTRWTLIQAVRDGTESERDKALETLSRTYWPPVYAFLRRLGNDRQQSSDVTQEFFRTVILERRLFDRAERTRGKLRTLLQTAIKRFCIDLHRRTPAGEADTVRLPQDELAAEEAFLASDSAGADPNARFDRRWAVLMLEVALLRCAEHFASSRSPQHWGLFQAWIEYPNRYGAAQTTLKQLAAEHGYETPAQASSAIQQVRDKVRVMLKQAIAETVERPEELEEELSMVTRILSLQ